MINQYKIPGLLLAFQFVAAISFAQTTTKLNLQEAIGLGIKNSKLLKISQSKINEASAVVQEATDARLPNFNLSSSYLRLSAANVDFKTASNSGGTNGGGTAAAEPVKPSQAVYGIANLSMPLFAGGRIKYGIESAKYLQQASVLDAVNDKDAIAFNTTKAFVNLYKAQETVNIVKENLHTSLSRDSSFSNLEKNGILARNDLLKAQLQTSNIELALLDAENNANLAMANMNLLLGQPESTLVEIDTAFVRIAEDLKTFPDYQALALQNRKDLQAIGFRKKAAATAIQSARAEGFPTIALTGGYIAANIPKVLTITNAINVGVGVQYNLASLWKKNTTLLQAKEREQQVIASEEILNDAIRLQVNQDYQNFMLSKKKIEVFEKANIQASENYRITNNKYNNSLATITELLEANVALLQSQLNIQTAKADAVLAYQKLLQTAGLSNY
jgi:outer membrane protein TolC